MAVVHGSKADIFLNGFDAGDWFNSVTSSGTKELNDCTVFNNSGYKAYHARMREATISCSGFFDATADADLGDAATLDPESGDWAFNAMIDGGVVGSADDIILHFPAGALAVGSKGFGAKGASTTYGIEGGSGDLLGVSVELTSCVGREMVQLAAVLSEETDAFDGTAIDNGAATEFGGSAYLMVPGWVSGDLPVIVEDSDDGLAWNTIGTFTEVDANHAYERITFTGTVERYVRVSANGTYVAAFLAAIHRHTR